MPKIERHAVQEMKQLLLDQKDVIELINDLGMTWHEPCPRAGCKYCEM